MKMTMIIIIELYTLKVRLRVCCLPSPSSLPTQTTSKSAEYLCWVCPQTVCFDRGSSKFKMATSYPKKGLNLTLTLLKMAHKALYDAKWPE